MRISKKHVELAVILIGIADAAYLSLEHLLPGILACSSNGLVNCQLVLSSRYAAILGIPLAFMGLAWTLLMFTIVYTGAERNAAAAYLIMGVGALGVAYSFAAQYSLGYICEYCTALDVVIITVILIHLLRNGKG